MAWRTGDVVTTEFTTRGSAGAVDADPLPTAVLVINGVDNGAAVTVTNKATGIYHAAVTLPTTAEGDLLQIRVSATVDGVSDNADVWSGRTSYSLPYAESGTPGTGLALAGGEMDLVDAPNDTALSAIGAKVEAMVLDEGDATALLAAISAKVEEFLINEGDATATIAAIATACNAAVAAGSVGTRVLLALPAIAPGEPTGLPTLNDVEDVIESETSGIPAEVWANVTRTLTDKTGFALTAAYDLYHADINVLVDEANTQDEYSITWFKNGVRVTSGITVPTLQVVKRADGTDLIASTTPTQIASTGTYKHDATTTARLTGGESALAIVTATIDGSSRTFAKLIGRDSTA